MKLVDNCIWLYPGSRVYVYKNSNGNYVRDGRGYFKANYRGEIRLIKITKKHKVVFIPDEEAKKLKYTPVKIQFEEGTNARIKFNWDGTIDINGPFFGKIEYGEKSIEREWPRGVILITEIRRVGDV